MSIKFKRYRKGSDPIKGEQVDIPEIDAANRSAQLLDLVIPRRTLTPAECLELWGPKRD